MRYLFAKKQQMVDAARALSGRSTQIMVPGRHFVLGTPIGPPFPDGFEQAQFALGCFWGAERVFWMLPGVFTTAVGYAGGYTPNPTYEEVCSGRTGHAETALVVFDPAATTYTALLQAFFEAHDPTQYMGQGNDIGTQYRSAIFTTTGAEATRATTVSERFGEKVVEAGFGPIMTEVTPAGSFYYAEEYHQQYLAKNPDGYCGLAGTGVCLNDPSEVHP